MSACLRCRSAVEPDDLRCAVCAASTPARQSSASGATLTVLRCDGCGAGITYDVNRKAPCCAFCGATVHLEQVVDPLEQAQLALPFGVSADAARGALDGFLRQGGFFRPGDLALAAGISAMQPMWWAAWVFDAEADVAFATDANAGGHRSKWAPYAGVTRMSFQRIAVSASRGLKDHESRQLVPGYDLASAGEVAAMTSAAPAETALERFELQRSAARGRVSEAITSIARNDVARHVPGTARRNTHVSLVLRELVTRRVLFPAWILTYSYRKKPYRVVVHGQQASIVTGERPISIARVVAVVALVVLLAGLLALIVALLSGR